MDMNPSRKGHKSGKPPGTLEYVGPSREFEPRLEMICYNGGDVRVVEVEECCPMRHPGEVCWFRIRGLHDVEMIRHIGDALGLSPMWLEDALNTGQRSKIEEHDDVLMVILEHFAHAKGAARLAEEQVSLFLGPDFVVSLAEGADDRFDPLIARLQKGKGRLRSHGPDYLFLMLIDAIIDNHYVVLDELGTELEELEADLLGMEAGDGLADIYRLRKSVLFLQRSLRPMREIVGTLRKSDLGFIADDNLVYARDIFDHGMQVVETVETYREILAQMLEIAMTSASLRNNAVMKVLTIIATIFIPLTFIAGVYGMNFRHMPELEWIYGYPMALGIMLAVAGGLLYYFRRQDWF